MKKGDLLEYSIWLTGTETEAQITHYQTEVLKGVKDATEFQAEVEIGPWSFEFKKPGEERMPQVPDHISGPDVRLMIASAKVGNRKPRPVERTVPGFSQDLTQDDLRKLRKMTRAAHAVDHPHQHLSDRNCDQIIDQLGPKVALDGLKLGKALILK